MEAASRGRTHLIAVRPREYIFTRFQLTVKKGPDEGKVVESDSAEFGIGTAQGSDLVLSDPSVSRVHCVITARPKGFLLKDMGSTNGTKLAGCRIEAAYLKPGVTIEVGITQLLFESLGEDVHEPLSDEEQYGRALGSSPAMRRIFAVLPRIAASDSTVLLEGETGTGKGLIAEMIHQASARAHGPFMVVDCSAIPPSLIEAELFGHEKGAFTGATAARPGVFEGARGGTVFLDEIGELPLAVQPKLLRALEERVVRRIGSLEPVRLDVRVIAATNRNLGKLVNIGAFRSDVYYRLKIVQIRLPPLRDRREDIALLTTYFYRQFVGEDTAEPPAELVESLTRRDWPGNVRELRNVVERVVLMGPVSEVSPSSIMPPDDESPRSQKSVFDASLSFRAAKERHVAEWERVYLTELLRRAGGNLSQAAREAKMDRNHLRELVRKHDVPFGPE